MIQTTIYTADVLTPEVARGYVTLDFTTWEAEGSWRGEPEASRVWQWIGTRTEGELLVAGIRLALSHTDEHSLYFTRQEVEGELVEIHTTVDDGHGPHPFDGKHCGPLCLPIERTIVRQTGPTSREW